MPSVMAPPRFLFVANRRQPAQPGFLLCRVTVDKVNVEFATKLRCARADWDAKAQQIRGKSDAVKTANKRLNHIRAQLDALGMEKDNAGLAYTAEQLVREWQGGGQPKTTLLQAWALFVEARRPLVGLSLSPGKLAQDVARGAHLEAFLRSQRLPGVLPDDFGPGLADDLLLYLRARCQHSQNYAAKIMQTVKQVLRYCVRRKYATRHPLDGYVLRFAPAPPAKFLTADELTRLQRFGFSSAPLRAAADCFLFQCYTGLAYVDLARFRRGEHTRLGPDGRPWLYMNRSKTQHSSAQEATVPLLPEALALLAYYGESLPVPTNQVYNRYLKEIAAVLGFDNLGLTSHVGRKTAGAQFLAAGFSLEAVSKMLGHSNVLITQRLYVQVTPNIVSREYARILARRPDAA